MKKKRKVVWVGATPITPISRKERRKISERIKKGHARLRKRYPEIHNKVVDFISHGVEHGTLYFSVRFKDKKEFSLRYACDLFIVGADFGDVSTGDYHMIREYMRPIAT